MVYGLLPTACAMMYFFCYCLIFVFLEPGEMRKHSLFDSSVLMLHEINRITLEFFRERPYLRFMDVTIEDPTANEQLASFLNLPEFQLLHENKGHYSKRHTAAPLLSARNNLKSIDFTDYGNLAPTPTPIQSRTNVRMAASHIIVVVLVAVAGALILVARRSSATTGRLITGDK
jgi:hypothetical protein